MTRGDTSVFWILLGVSLGCMAAALPGCTVCPPRAGYANGYGDMDRAIAEDKIPPYIQGLLERFRIELHKERVRQARDRQHGIVKP